MPANRLTSALVLLCALLLVSCRPDTIEEVPDAVSPVSLLSSSVNILPGGTAGIAFRCEGFSSASRVSLRMRDGNAPVYFILNDVREGAGPGLGTAVIGDKGADGAYSVEVCVVVDGVSSDFVCVNCGPADYPDDPDTGLPVVFIDTEGLRPVDSRSVARQAVLKVREGAGCPGLVPASCTVRGRGNTSWEWPKKPYRLDFRDRVSMLGMPASRHWVLLANFSDRTMMRNMLAMQVSSLTSLAWTPRCEPVELVLNGEHQGCYLLIEQVEADENRVDVAPDGFLLELDFHYDAPNRWIDPHGLSMLGLGIPFAVRYPTASALDADTEAYIKKYVSDAAGALYSSSFADPSDGYARWLDVDSFVDYWLVFAVMGNPELANPGSVFFHMRAGEKLAAGPCWDFDWSLTEFGNDVQGWSRIISRNAIWYARLFRDPAFAARVRERFLELKPALTDLTDYIDGCAKMLRASSELNFALWNPAEDRWQNKGMLILGDENLPFSEAVALLRKVYLRRLELLEEKL